LIKDLWSYRSLMWALTRRQYQLRYRQSAAGLLWALVGPLATLAAATLVFHKVAGIDTGNIPYPLFAMAALVPWSFFASCLNFGAQSVTQAGSLVTRFAFPRIVFPLSFIGTAFIDLAIASGVFLVYLLVIGQRLPITALWFPFLLAIELALVIGLGALLAAMNVFARDVKLIVPLALQLWLLVTPVMYPLSAVPQSLRWLYLANPMTGLVTSFRWALIPPGHAPSLELLAPALIGVALSLTVGLWYFGATESRFADAM
jgi:lipopolysaccharide transport system permease protein